MHCADDGLESSTAMLEDTRKRILEYNNGKSALERGKEIKKIFPLLAEDIIRMADQAMEGMLVLPGTGPDLFFVGNPPLWQSNPCGDNEYTYFLNRMFHVKTLSEAYSLTGNLMYAEKAISEMRNWIETVHCPGILDESGAYDLQAFDCCSPWRALEVGIRGYRTWPIIIELLADTPFYTEDFHCLVLKSCREHCRILSEISPKLWPDADHNHYIMENLGLLSLTLLFPEIDPEGNMRKQAEDELSRCIENQSTADGGQIEGCPSYHNGSVYWFSLRNSISRKYGIPVPDEYTDRLKRMFVHSIHATRPSGGNFPWGDSHTAEKETMSLAAIACYMATGERKYLQSAAYFSPSRIIEKDMRDNLWRFTDLDKLRIDYEYAAENPLKPELPCVEWDKELKQAFIRTGWEKDAVAVMTACRTPIKNNHAHMDPGGFDFTAYGEPLVSDPGIYTYKDSIDRYHFKSTGWHNCAMINHKDAWQYIASWKYGKQKPGDIIEVQDDDICMTVISEHMNYEPVRMRRMLSLIDSRMLLVIDAAYGMADGDTMQSTFHINSPQVRMVGMNCIASYSTGKPNVLIASSGDCAGTEIISGKISTDNDVWHDSMIVRFNTGKAGHGYTVHAALLVPFKSGEDIVSPIPLRLDAEESSISASFCFNGRSYAVVHRDLKTTVEIKEV